MKSINRKKTDANYWYSDIDIYQLLIEKSFNNHFYKVIDFASHDYELSGQNLEKMKHSHDQTLITTRISQAVNFLDSSQTQAAVIPINLGQKSNAGIWEGRHWVGLVIKRNQDNDLEAFYCDSLGKRCQSNYHS